MMATKDDAMATVKAAMMPQIDAALTLWLDNLSALMRAASAEEVDRCIAIVEGCAMVAPAPVASSMTARAGWNEAIRFAADRLREWKTAAAEGSPTGSAAKGEP